MFGALLYSHEEDRSKKDGPISFSYTIEGYLGPFWALLEGDRKLKLIIHGLRTPNEGINQRYLKNWADVADKICFGRT